jgi:GNAT superfamily N-acetyltransferase
MEAATTALSGYRAATSIDRICLLQEVRGPEGREWIVLADALFGRPAIVGTGSPLALELVRSELIDPEAAALLEDEGFGPAGGMGHAGVVTNAGDVASAGHGARAGDGEDAARPPTRQLVVTARRQGTVVGVAAAWLTADGGRIAVLVDSSHRREGIGTHLLAAVESAAAGAGWGCTSFNGVGVPGFYAARSRITRSGSMSNG